MSSISSNGQLRIRPDNGTVRELKIPKDKLELLEKIVASPQKTDQYKKWQIKKHTKVSPCGVCGGIPAYEISYPFSEGGITRVEYYCSKCIERVYSREPVLQLPYSNINRHRLIIKPKSKLKPVPRPLISDKDIRIIKSHCDLCNDELSREADNIQYRINVLDEINDSFESEYDKHEPRLLLCSFCTKEYNIPSYLQ